MAGSSRATIGIFDSGVGGVSVLRELRTLLDGQRLVYIADSAHVPYGTKPHVFIQARSTALSKLLINEYGAAVVLVACNTATTHAVDHLRERFPSVPFVGMEPGIKPAAAATRSGVVGVLATSATLAGGRFASLVQRTAEGVEVLTQACAGLVEQVEAGDLDGPATRAILDQCLAPMLSRGADTIVLGCTHYPFLRPTIQAMVGPDVTLIDTAGAVARQTIRMLHASGGETHGTPGTHGPVRFLTSGQPEVVRVVLERLWGEPVPEVGRIAP